MKPWNPLAYSCWSLSWFSVAVKLLGVFLLSLDWMLVHRRSFPCNLLGFPNNSPVTIYTPGWREAMSDTCTRNAFLKGYEYFTTQIMQDKTLISVPRTFVQHSRLLKSWVPRMATLKNFTPVKYILVAVLESDRK